MDKQIPHILIVDDDPHLSGSISDILKAKGFAPLFALTGASALTSIEQNDITVALIDLRLGDMSGLDVLRGIKARSPQTECIMLTGHASQNSAIEAVQLGAYSYFQKPFELEQFLLSIQRAVEKHDAVQVLRENEERYRLLFENAPVGIFSATPDGQILEINSVALQILGSPSVEATRAINLLTFPLLVQTGFSANYKTCVETGQPVFAEHVYTSKWGKFVYAQYRMTPVRDPGGQVTLVQVILEDITERKLNEDKVLKLAFMLDTAPNSVTVHDFDGNFLMVNQRTLAMHGYTREEFMALNLHQLDVPESEQLISQRMQVLREHGEAIFETYHYRKDGSIFPLEVNVLISNWGDQPAILSIATDITERKRVAEKLAASEAELRALFTSMRDVVLVIDQEGIYRKIAPTNPDLLVTSPDELLGKNLRDVFPVEQAETFIGVMREVLQSGQTAHIEYELDININRTWFETSISPMDGDSTLWVARDITERKKLELALRAREEQYRTLIEQLPSIIYVDDVNVEGRTLYISPQLETILGFTPQEWMDGSHVLWAQQVHPDDLEWVHAEYMRCLQDGKPLDCEYRIRSSDGRLLWFRDQAALLRDENDRPHLIQGMIYDISERKQVEQVIDQRVLELELLYESGLAFIQLLHPTEIAQKVIDLLEQKMDWHHTAIRLYDRETDTLQLLAFNQAGLNSAEEITTAKELLKRKLTRPDQGLSGWAFRHGQTVRVDDLAHDGRYFETVPGMQSGLYVPIKLGDHVIGVISIESERSNAFSDADERLTNTLTNQAANALENARLFDETGRRGREFASLYETSKVLSAIYDLDTLLEIIVNRTKEMLNSSTSGMYLYHTESQELELTVDTSYTIPIGSRLRLGEGVAGQVAQSGQPMRIDDYSTWEGRSEKFSDHSIHAVIEVPMLYAGELIGVLTADETGDSNRKFTEADERLLSLFATQAAGAITAVRHHAETLRYADELEQRVEERTVEIETTRQRLELAANAGGIGVWEINIKENMIFWDMRMHVIHGTDPAQFDNSLGAWMQTIHPEDLAYVNGQFQDAVQNTGTYSLEHRIVRADGSLRYVSTNAIVVYDDEHNPERMIGVNMDITERKHAEVALHLANLEMERAMRTKDEFLATMSHELRTPLNSILGISESLEEQISGTLNPKQLRYIGIVKESGRHLLELINDILDISKIEAGRMELELQNISVDKLCQSSLRMVRELAQKKSLKVSFEMINKVDVIFGDERRMKQSLVNLLSNAVKFTPVGSHIGLEVCGHPQENEVTLTVWDKGVGIAEENVKLLFQPFVQLDAGLAREYQGTGLGLALVSQMMRLHGGHVSLESKIGEGSRFTITLPWLPEQQNIQFKSMVTSYDPVKKIETKHTGSILLVEDTEVIISLMTDYLQYKGYRVLSAHNGMEGLMLAKQEHPDLIIMDVMMPVMDGFEATRHIREVDKNTPIIALTALAMPGDRERCLAAGMSDYLSKPIRIQELADMIEKYLTGKGQTPNGQ